MNKSYVKRLCEIKAIQYGWVYQNHKFKSTALSHSIIFIDPSWSLHLSAQPSIKVFNKSVTKLLKESFHDFQQVPLWTARMLILSPDAFNNCMVYQKLVHNLDEAEEYIDDFFNRGLNLIDQYFSNEDEKAFLSSYPIVGIFPTQGTDSGYEGLGNCLARALLLDFDYVERFIKGDFPTDRPIYYRYQDRMAEWLPIWKERAERTGSILKK